MEMHELVTFDVEDFVEDFTHCFTGECRVNVLPFLFQICQIITDDEDLATSLAVILKVMQQRPWRYERASCP
jgi:Nif-specific regulatory protein